MTSILTSKFEKHEKYYPNYFQKRNDWYVYSLTGYMFEDRVYKSVVVRSFITIKNNKYYLVVYESNTLDSDKHYRKLITYKCIDVNSYGNITYSDGIGNKYGIHGGLQSRRILTEWEITYDVRLILRAQIIRSFLRIRINKALNQYQSLKQLNTYYKEQFNMLKMNESIDYESTYTDFISDKSTYIKYHINTCNEYLHIPKCTLIEVIGDTRRKIDYSNSMVDLEYHINHSTNIRFIMKSRLVKDKQTNNYTVHLYIQEIHINKNKINTALNSRDLSEDLKMYMLGLDYRPKNIKKLIEQREITTRHFFK